MAKLEFKEGSKLASEKEVKWSGKQKEERDSAIRLERNGEHMLDRKHLNEAEEFFQGALHIYKKINDFESMGRIYYRLGQIEEQRQKFEGAISYYQKSKEYYHKVENKKDYAIVVDRIAKMYYFQNQTDLAMREYTQAIEENAANSEIYNNLAFLQMGREEFEKALENLQKALQMREKEESPEIHITYNNLGVIEYIKGNLPKAQEYFETGLELDLRPPEEDRSIQYTIFASPEYKGETFKKYRVFDDVNTRACLMLNIASARLSQNKEDESVLPLLEEALDQDKDRAYLYEAAGWIHLNKGDEKKALAYFKRAIPYDPTNEDLKKVITLINPYIYAKVGRNDPCPCGSGKKYKKCHGAMV